MQFTTIVLALAGASTTFAAAVPVAPRQAGLCSGLSGTPQCCATNVLDLADLNCASPPTTPTDVNDFINICAAEGQQAQCCTLSILGQALLCENVNPTA